MWSVVLQVLAAAVASLGGAMALFGVRPVVFKLMSLYQSFNVLMLRVRGRSPATEADRRVVTGQAWAEWCDALKAAGATLLSPGCPDDAFNQAEGYRYLSRLARVSLENFVECASTDAPRLVALANGWRDAPVHIGSDNPDNVYQSANISGRKTYRLRVQRGSVHYLGFGTQSGSYGTPGGLQTVDYKEAKEFTPDSDGSLEIFIAPERPAQAKNWLRTIPDPEKALLIVRQTREDHDGEVLAECEIECIAGGSAGSASNKPAPLTAADLDAGLRTSAMFVAGAPVMFARLAHGFQKHVNELPLFDQETSNKIGGDPGIRYYHSYWRLAPDEALVISATPPKCATWNFQVNNHWMEALDFRYHNIHVNKFTAKYRADGSVRVVVAARDPDGLKERVGPYTWLETTGHDCGTMCWRWLQPETDENLPQPQTKVVKLSDLEEALK